MIGVRVPRRAIELSETILRDLDPYHAALIWCGGSARQRPRVPTLGNCNPGTYGAVARVPALSGLDVAELEQNDLYNSIGNIGKAGNSGWGY